MMRLLYSLIGLIHRTMAGLIRILASMLGRLGAALPVPMRVGLGFAVMGAVTAIAGLSVGDWLMGRCADVYALDGEPLAELQRLMASGELSWWRWCALGSALACLAGAALVLWRHRVSHRLMCLAWGIAAFVWAWALRLVNAVPTRLFETDSEVFPITYRHELVLALAGWWLVGAIPVVIVLVVTGHSATRQYFGAPGFRSTGPCCSAFSSWSCRPCCAAAGWRTPTASSRARASRSSRW